METGDRSAREELELIEWTNDSLPSSVFALNAEGVVVYCNGPAADMVPTLTVGSSLRDELANLTHEEKIDRLLIRREITTFPGKSGGPELHWIVWEGPGKDGWLVLTVWETDWNDVMNERRAEFMMAASHELRSPLTTLQGFAELLNLDPSNLTPEQAEAAEIIERTSRHLTVLVQDVFDLSRNSFGELRLNICTVDLRDVLESVVAQISAVTSERGQTLTCTLDPDLPVIKGDEARTTQMISNLVNNASVHNPEGTAIVVKAGIQGDHVAVSVSDDGRGLPFDDPDDAFRSFRRGPGATAGDRTGSGIGLSLTKRLIQLHRGDITVESRPGEGSTFTLLFPIDRESEAAHAPGEPGPV
jgi:signal transduction histidine kinase